MDEIKPWIIENADFRELMKKYNRQRVFFFWIHLNIPAINHTVIDVSLMITRISKL
jgi:hypothetical protein